MEWYDDRALQEEDNAIPHHVLSTTSGNAQVFPTNSKRVNGHDSLAADNSYTSSWPSKHPYPMSRNTLGSNDRQALIRHKYHLKRLKRRLLLAQKYLQHPKFLNFKTRPRKDVIKKTGEIIWDEETETAFQNAIINIPAMGRKKKSQHGKTLGRNELITEWIMQETGKYRDRKQISSHKQTLDGIFKATGEFAGVPEWKLVSRGIDDNNSECDGPEFYDNSIADMVRNWRMLQADLSKVDCDYEALYQPSVSSYNANPLQKICLDRLEFEMWVSLPDRMDEALHRYTRAQSNRATAAPDSLENIQGWRSSWPELVPLIDRSSNVPKFEIILLSASFELMLDFPPPRSKLGISLELNFAHGLDVSVHPVSWTCITYIYQRGRLETMTEHHECHSPGFGRVKPPFESKWWAEQFTRLTEKRRHAIDAANDAAIAVADEAARNYLRNLTIMQQLVVRTESSEASLRNKDIHLQTETRIAVLLWSFAQATPGFVGVTTWQRLIPPPHRSTTNSPLPSSHEFALPPLNIDSTLDETFSDSAFRFIDGYVPESLQPADDSYSPNEDQELCQDGFMVAAQQENFSNVQAPYYATSPLEGSTRDYYNQHAFDFNLQQTTRQAVPYDAELSTNQGHHYSQNLFRPQQRGEDNYTNIDMRNSHSHGYQLDVKRRSSIEDRKQALLTFDVGTHELLQAQLQDDHDSRRAPTSDYTQPTHSQQQEPFITLPSSSATGDSTPHGPLASSIGSRDYTHVRVIDATQILQRRSHRAEDLPTVMLAPTAVRPLLQHHHSFAGIMPIDSTAMSLDRSHDVYSHHEFSVLVDSFDGNSTNLFGCTSNFVPLNSGVCLDIGLGIPRSHSQPPTLEKMTKSQNITHREFEPDSADQEDTRADMSAERGSEVKIEEISTVEVR